MNKRWRKKWKLRALRMWCTSLLVVGTWNLIDLSFLNMNQVSYASALPAVPLQQSHATSLQLNERQPFSLSQAVATANKHNKQNEAGKTGKSSQTGSKATSSHQQKIVYLTFDDGPSKHTKDVLDILENEKVPATFYVLGQQVERNPDLVERIVSDGHALGNHTYDHNYKELYSDFSHFWSQVQQTGQAIENITGSEPLLVRAPGGTYANFDQQYFDLLARAGYVVFDWNVDSADSRRRGVPASEIIAAVKKGVLLPHTVVLMHDSGGHGETVKALPAIIKYYKDKGYTFAKMTPTMKPVQFRVANTAGWGRTPVSAAWIAEHVKTKPQAKQLVDKQTKEKKETKETKETKESKESKPTKVVQPTGVAQLVIQTDQGDIRFAPNQFKTVNEQTYVPLRQLIEQLGGQVGLDSETNLLQIEWNEQTYVLDVTGNTIEQQQPTEGALRQALDIQAESEVVWVSLRQMLRVLKVELNTYELTTVTP
ncbi:polysaccharide deacetylase family protein [Paenibacillus sp. 481]|uniref:polysaccharide deacetylase family protein n=1 Tax=Paenibacillus sp. 481 TaxID=2835869 RepID=UPI001E3211CC|nr:polysaccharide deacetylase family protein [Paenibacillus sp. 481]UHA71818.1 polysaccharide deacetylase [Paenibacillus sp. 481]